MIVRVIRGEEAESAHRGAICAWRGSDVIVEHGHVDRPVFVRSGAKFFQALPTLVVGAPDRFRLADRHLALMCASHGGEPDHVTTVREMLDAGGLDPGHLGCGMHPPLHGRTAADLSSRDETPTVLHNNCSGKHAGMLLAARARGDDVDDYLDPAHPVQLAIREALATMAEVTPASLRAYVDGCNAPTWVLPLRTTARAFRNHGTTPRSFDASLRSATTRLHRAIAAAPRMVAGSDRLCTALAQTTSGRLLGKIGAEGFYGVMSTTEPFSLAVSIDDGSWVAAERVACQVLHELGMLTDDELQSLARYAGLVRRNHAGKEVGRFIVDSGR